MHTTTSLTYQRSHSFIPMKNQSLQFLDHILSSFTSLNFSSTWVRRKKNKWNYLVRKKQSLLLENKKLPKSRNKVFFEG